jgi:hypothetical protein
VIAASIAAGIAPGSAGNVQVASGAGACACACAIALPASAPVNIVAENSVRSIFFFPTQIERLIIAPGIAVPAAIALPALAGIN